MSPETFRQLAAECKEMTKHDKKPDNGVAKM
jgi:hypothetical protein